MAGPDDLTPDIGASVPVHDALDLSGPDLSTHHLMTLTTRLDALVRKAEKVITEIHRLNEQSGAAIQRAFSGQADSVTALATTVGSAATDVTGLLDEVMSSLAETREVMNRNEALVQKLIDGLHDASDHFVELVEAADGPVGQLLDPERVTAQLDHALAPVMKELEQSRTLLREAARRSQRGTLNPAKLREQLTAALSDLATELRGEIETLATELHEDRALLTKRVAGRRDIEQLRELLELREPEAPAPEITEALRVELETLVAGLRDEAAGIARRLTSNSRDLEQLRSDVTDLVSGVGADLRHDTETMVGELHDDLALLMKQLLMTTQELETVRELVERPLPAPSSHATEDAREAIEAVAVEIRTGVERTVTELHDDLGVLLKRMADNQQEFDELRQAITDLERPAAPAARVDTGEVRDLITEVHEDLAVVARQLAGAREQVEQLRAEVPPAEERAAARAEELRGDVLAGLGAVASDLRDEIDSMRTALDREQAPPTLDPGVIRGEVDQALTDLRDDLAVMMSQVVAGQDLVDALRVQLAQQLTAATEALDGEVKGEFERLRRLLARQRDEQRNAPGPDYTEVTEHVTAAAREVRDDVNLVVEQAAAVQQDLATLGHRIDQVAAATAAAADAGPALTELVSGLADDVATVVRGLGGLQVEVGELQAVVAAPPPVPDVAGEVAQATEPLHDDLALLARQVGGVRDELAALQTAVASASEATAAGMEQNLTPLHDDLSVLVRQAVAIAEEVAGARSQLAELSAVPPPDVATEMSSVAASLHDDLALLFTELTGTRTDVAQVRAALADLPVPDVAAEVAAATEPVQEDLSALVRQITQVRAALEELAPAADVAQIEATVQEGLGVVVGEVAAAREELGHVRAEIADAVAASGAGADLAPQLAPIGQDLAALIRQVAGAREELDELRLLAGEAASPPDVRPEVDAVRDDVALVLQQVAQVQEELGNLRAELTEAAEVEVEVEPEPVEPGIDVADLPALFAEEVRVELQAVAAELRSDLDQLRRRLGAAQKERTDPAVTADDIRNEVAAGVAEIAARMREEVETAVAGLHDDITNLMHEVVVGQEAVSAVRDDVASLGAVEPTAPAAVGAEVSETVAAVAADLRAEIETMVNDLHDDIAIVMRQVVSTQEDVTELRLQLSEGAGAPSPAVDQMAAELDRLTQELETLRERIPTGGATTRPRTRTPRARR